MKKNEIQELRKLSIKEIEKKILEKQKEVIETAMKLKKGELTNTRKSKTLKTDIAQMKTIISEKKLMEKSK